MAAIGSPVPKGILEGVGFRLVKRCWLDTLSAATSSGVKCLIAASSFKPFAISSETFIVRLVIRFILPKHSFAYDGIAFYDESAGFFRDARIMTLVEIRLNGSLERPADPRRIWGPRPFSCVGVPLLRRY